MDALKAEKFNFDSYDAQLMLKEAASRGEADTVSEFLDAGIPRKPLPAPKPESPDAIPWDNGGWLEAASSHSDTLRVLLDAGVGKGDQKDLDLALAGAAKSGNLEAARALIVHGADPTADLSQYTITQSFGGMFVEMRGPGSILIDAADSGNPEMVREILRYHPFLEARDHEGKTAMFAAGDYRDTDKDGARVEIVRMLAAAGADVNARDKDGNTPLHEIFVTEVEEELLKLGADVNARNNEGETPIFTTVDNDSIPLFIKYGADLSVRNDNGQTVMEAAKDKGPLRQEALRNAIRQMNSRSASQ